MQWRKSSFSGGSGSGDDSCVEVALIDEKTAVRDSKNADGPVLTVSADAWRALLVWS